MIKQLRQSFYNNILIPTTISNILKLSAWKLALISGILVGLAYPPLKLGFLIWFGLIPLIHILLNTKPRNATIFAFLASITANFISLYWIGLNSGAGFIPVFASLIGAVLYLSLFWSAFGYLVAFIEARKSWGLWIIPFAWVAMELIRSFGPLGFPWINLALTQTQYLPMIQIADITGSYGIAFWILLINVGLYKVLISNNKQRYLLFAGAIFLIIFVYGEFRIKQFSTIDGETISLVITQPNINPDEKWEPELRDENFRLMHTLLDSAINLKPDIILWPESAVPAYLRLANHRRTPITRKLAKHNIPLLSGTIDRKIGKDGKKKYYNGSVLIRPDGKLKMYHKIHLVPFAEYIPLSGKFPSLKKLNLGQANFSHGNDYTVFNVKSVGFSNVICYESSIPKIIRELIKNGAQFLTIQANDGWLGKSSGPYQHFELAKLRAVENRIPIVRCANTGISGVIDRTGTVSNKVPLGVKSVSKINIIPSEQHTFYTKNGELFANLCVLITLGIFVLTWLKQSKY